jgi:hypothetical protein
MGCMSHPADAENALAGVVAEVSAAVHEQVAATNRMWESGVIEPGSALRDVAADLTAVQHSPRFADGVWRAGSGAEWLDGTAEAAAFLAGQGCRWTLHDLRVLARSADEAVAGYRIVHEWADARPAAQALFLETWRRDGARWVLARHTAEKV